MLTRLTDMLVTAWLDTRGLVAKQVSTSNKV